MSAHTPGPWVVTTSNFADRIHLEGQPEVCIAETGNWLTHEKAEQHANARLIAAAPDLLAVLKVALEEIDCEIEARKYGQNGDDWADLQKVSDDGHAAIAKATIQPLSGGEG